MVDAPGNLLFGQIDQIYKVRFMNFVKAERVKYEIRYRENYTLKMLIWNFFKWWMRREIFFVGSGIKWNVETLYSTIL
jgi:hypothetical protein